MRYGSILPLLLLAVAACRENAGQASSSASSRDSLAPHDTAVSSPSLSTPEGFEKSLFHEFAHVATAVPRHVSDSILKAGSDPRQIEASMKQYLRRRDSLARSAVAARHGITVDSLNVILARGNAGRW